MWIKQHTHSYRVFFSMNKIVPFSDHMLNVNLVFSRLDFIISIEITNSNVWNIWIKDIIVVSLSYVIYFSKRGSGISPIRFSPIGLSPIHPVEFRQLTKVHCNFVNTFRGVSPIGESTVNFQQLHCKLDVD